MFESKEIKNMEGKYFGLYRAIISNVQDPEKLGRIKVYCPAIYGEGIESGWIIPAMQFIGNDFGIYCIPPSSIKGKTTYVWIMFEMGDPDYPVWLGSPIGMTNGLTDLHKVFRKRHDGSDRLIPNNYGIVTPGGHRIELDDDNLSNQIRIIHAKGTKIIINDDGIVLNGDLSVNGSVDISGNIHASNIG